MENNMRKMLMSGVFAVVAIQGIYAQSSSQGFSDGAGLEYAYEVGPHTEDLQHLMWSEFWDIKDQEVIRDKMYLKVYRRLYRWDKIFADFEDKDWWESSDFDTRAIGHVVSIREEGNRVYADKAMYVELIKTLFPAKNTIYCAEAEDPNEVLLYDFGLEKGDRYPFLDGDVTIADVTEYQGRKVQRLSNGLIIIEGIGCINSVGTFIVYQNTPIDIELQYARVSPRKSASEHPQLVAALASHNQGLSYWDFKVLTEVVNVKYEEPAYVIYTLSGRRLPTLPTQKGIYIKDGRKVLIK